MRQRGSWPRVLLRCRAARSARAAPPRAVRATRHRHRARQLARPISIRASASTKRRRRCTSCSSARCSRSTTTCASCRTSRRASRPPTPQTYVAEIPPGVQFHDGREMTSEDVAYTFRRFLDPAFVSGRRAPTATSPPSTSSTLHGRLPPEAAVGVVSRSTSSWASCRPAPAPRPRARRSAAGRTRSPSSCPTTTCTLAPFAGYYARRARRTPASSSRSCPTRRCAGSSCARAASISSSTTCRPTWCTASQRRRRSPVVTAPGTDYAYIGLQPARPDARRIGACGRPSATRSTREAIVSLPPARPGAAGDRHRAVRCRGRTPTDVLRFTHDPAQARGAARRGRLPRSRRRRARRRACADAQDVDRRALPPAGRRDPAAISPRSASRSTCGRTSSRRSWPTCCSGNVQLYTLQWVGVTDPDMLRRAFHSTQVPPGGFNRGHYANPEVDRLIDEASAVARRSRARAGCISEAQRLIAADAPYISLWDKTNVAVAQPDLDGVTLSPIADFAFLAETCPALNRHDRMRRMSRRKSRFLRKPVEPFVVDGGPVGRRRARRAWSASRSRAATSRPRAASGKRCSASDATIFLGTAGALSAGGMRLIIAHLIEHRYIDCLVSTGANLYHDLHETRGRRHFIGSPHARRRRAGRRAHRSRLRHAGQRGRVLQERRVDRGVRR